MTRHSRVILCFAGLIATLLCGCSDSQKSTVSQDLSSTAIQSSSTVQQVDSIPTDKSEVQAISAGGTAKTTVDTPKLSAKYSNQFEDKTVGETIQLENADGSISISIFPFYYDTSSDEMEFNKDKWLKKHKDKWLYNGIVEDTIGDKDVAYVIYGQTKNAVYHSLRAMYKTGVKCKTNSGENTELSVRVVIKRKDLDYDFSKSEAEELISLLKEIIPTIEISAIDSLNCKA